MSNKVKIVHEGDKLWKYRYELRAWQRRMEQRMRLKRLLKEARQREGTI